MTQNHRPPLCDLIRARSSRLPIGWRVAALVGGVLFLLAGVVGWLIPVVTGIPFYVVGLGLLGTASERVRRSVNRTEARLPHGWRVRVRRVLGRPVPGEG